MRVTAIILAAASITQAADPVQHATTGIWLPAQLAELPLTSVDPPTETSPSAGYSFSHPTRPISATLYISKLNVPPPPDDIEERVRTELARSLIAIESVAESGRYENLRMGPARQSTTVLAGAPLFVADASFTFAFPDKATKNLPAFASVRSFVATAIYADHVFKLRYTEPSGSRWTGSQDPDVRATTTFEAFIDIFREHALRPQIDKALHAYRAEPFSDEGLMAAAFLFTYADESALATIDLGQNVLDLVGYGAPEPADPASTRHLLNAYVIGNFAQQFESDTWTDQPDAGRQQVLQTYRALQKRDATFSLPHLDQTATTTSE